MAWSVVRLSMARTPAFPEGSSEHAYELVLPLLADGLIDRDAFDAMPARASVMSIWPGEGVRRGAILRQRKGWAFSYRPGDADDEDIFHLEDHPLAAGSYLTLTEPDGERIPYRVVAIGRLRGADRGEGTAS